MINTVFVSMAVLSEVLVAACDKFRVGLTGLNIAGKLMPSQVRKIPTKLTRRVSLAVGTNFVGRWNGHPSRKHARGFVGNPIRSKTALQGASPSRATARGPDLQERH